MSACRLGGWLINDEEAIAWGARLSRKPVEEVDWDFALMVIRRHLRKFGITLTGVTYPKDVDILMVVTRAEPYVGWRKGDDPTQLKQFGKGKLEAMVLKALEREGVKQTEYVTAHGWL